ncbi:PepSY-associated TM helix domain-containing protein [Allorhodopirellula heiligendammensis]|uniref:PepSY-associated TM helix n=1 Tax=Allorhodopirellula heiligendammensis TaxID=2714739 RepID=A0A5C6BKE9_9BACT|nr:PepSY-associated TM helix domain-containing protein [Allorhodopirellula heiligendammensis]TWU10924.1 hypothetical protein Poly21_48300 [Allorhodopirellula heiligendammensis]
MPANTESDITPRKYRLRTIIAWHWISSAVSLVGMMLFAITGITLNHAAQIKSDVVTETLSAELPPQLLATLNASAADGLEPLPVELSDWLGDQFRKPIGRRSAEWSEDEIYISMPGPGSDAWLAIDRETGAVEFEQTHRGWVSYFNDLHKGRNTGAAWKWVLDLFALSTLVFCVTGLLLLIEHARRRSMTWPLVGLGLVAPWLVAILLIH